VQLGAGWKARVESNLEASRRRHGNSGKIIDIKTERDAEMFARLEKQATRAERVGADGDESAGSGGARRGSYSAVSLEDMEAQVSSWMAAILGEALPTVESGLQATLKDGVLLCRLANTLAPGATPPPSASALPFKQMENIAAYLKASLGLGLQPFDQFQTVDLFEGKGMRAVCSNLLALRRLFPAANSGQPVQAEAEPVMAEPPEPEVATEQKEEEAAAQEEAAQQATQEEAQEEARAAQEAAAPKASDEPDAVEAS